MVVCVQLHLFSPVGGVNEVLPAMPKVTVYTTTCSKTLLKINHPKKKNSVPSPGFEPGAPGK